MEYVNRTKFLNINKLELCDYEDVMISELSSEHFYAYYKACYDNNLELLKILYTICINHHKEFTNHIYFGLLITCKYENYQCFKFLISKIDYDENLFDILYIYCKNKNFFKILHKMKK